MGTHGIPWLDRGPYFIPRVTPKLRNKVILSKAILRDLMVITEDFPNIIIKERSPLTRGANRKSLLKNREITRTCKREGLRGVNCKSPCIMS